MIAEQPDGLVAIGGALIASASICPRQVWLMVHQINPDEDDPNLEYGRFVHATAYQREGREIELRGSKFDVIAVKDNTIVVAEVKKSSKAIEGARLQLAHYLLLLEEQGIHAIGELRFPEERGRERVTLTNELRQAVLAQRQYIYRIAELRQPPPPKRIRWCSKCAYAELCWG
ncbi:MAG: CRISPR-associated protein Cas4 [Firmicutes bacterium]|nr:CRISPR-associated protein Cas4 [Bacillota bacterium]